MTTLTTSAPIDPKTLSPAQIEALTDQLYPIQQDIFDGVSRDSFQKYVITPDTAKTKIFLLHSAAGEIAGYFTFQVYRVPVSRKSRKHKVYVFRGETGILKQFRGKVRYIRPLMREIFRFLLTHGWPEAYLVAAPIHPTPYCILQRSIHELYPRPAQETPEPIGQLMAQLSDTLRMQRPEGATHHVKDVGWIVKDCERKHRIMLRSKAADVQFFLEQNPGYREGHGLMILAPATLRNAWRTLRMHWQPERKLVQRFRRLRTLNPSFSFNHPTTQS
jgi:hypothetical protein